MIRVNRIAEKRRRMLHACSAEGGWEVSAVMAGCFSVAPLFDSGVALNVRAA